MSAEDAVTGFETSPTTEKLDAALAKAQASIGTAKKDKVNPHFKSKYADLAAVWEACHAALSGNGVSVTQWPVHSTDGRLHIITRLACSGEWMRAHFSIPIKQTDAHGYGSATTYAKRFALSAAVGVAADDEDDDGNEASKPTTALGVEAVKQKMDEVTKLSEPGVWELIQILGKENNLKPLQVNQLVKASTGKTKPSQLVPGDVDKFKAALALQRLGASEVSAQPKEPELEEAPF